MLALPTALLSIGSGILLFCTMLVLLTKDIVTAFQIRAGVPLSYALLPHGSLDWFYFPANLFLFLGVTALVASLSLIVIGKHISKTPGNIIRGLASYALLYGLVVPLWLLRATADVTLGKRRDWRY